jgi:hypothetical protein
MAAKKPKMAKRTPAATTSTPKPKFGSPAWNAKYGIKKAKGK